MGVLVPQAAPGQGGRLLVTGLVIRKASPQDLGAILALYAEPDIDDGHVLDLSGAERIYERMQRYPSYATYVAVLEGEVVGTFALLIMDNLAHMGAPSGVVEDVVVHSRWRGQGVGRRMMRFAMERCREAGCYKLALSSNRKRADAHRFYESLGFVRHGYSFIVPFDVGS
jgi:GNAT superfamily N-acetyltransferase